MNRAQLDRIPDELLGRNKHRELAVWLHARGWRMSLLELDTERRHRSLIPNRRSTS